MKKIILMSLLSILCVVILPQQIEAKKIQLNESVTSTDGCRWKIVGWIDVSFIPPKINQYDVTITDCHGNVTHFVGLVLNQNNPLENQCLSDFNYQYEILSVLSPNNILSPIDIFNIIKSISLNLQNQND